MARPGYPSLPAQQCSTNSFGVGSVFCALHGMPKFSRPSAAGIRVLIAACVNAVCSVRLLAWGARDFPHVSTVLPRSDS
eukprot:3382022-Pyramimonas_sp.AAC.1